MGEAISLVPYKMCKNPAVQKTTGISAEQKDKIVREEGPEQKK
jgi:hypothetical protein